MKRHKRKVRRMALLSSIVLIAIGAVFIIASVRQSAMQRLMDESRELGLAAHQRGEYDTALSKLGYYLSRERHDLDALLAFAEARSKVPLENRRHVEQAISYYNSALDLGPGNVVVLERLLELNERINRRIEWMHIARRILEIDPDHIRAMRAEAIGHYMNSHLDEAAVACDRLIERDPDEVTWRALRLQIMQDQGATVDQLLAVCDRWMNEHTVDGRYHMIKAQLLTASGQREAATAMAVQAAALGALTQAVLDHLVTLLDALHLPDAASDVIHAAQQRFPDESWVHEASVRRLWQAGNIEQALGELQAITESGHSLDSGLLRWRSILLMLSEQGRTRPALLADLIDAATKGGDNLPDAQRALAKAAAARMSMARDDWSSALQELRQATALQPDEPVLHYMMGEALSQVREHELAAASLQRVVRAEPHWITAQWLYAQTLLRLGREDEAARLAARLLERSEAPTLDQYILFARAWISAGPDAPDISLHDPETGQALNPTSLLEKMHNLSPEHPEVIELLVENYLSNGARAEAIASVTAALETDAPDEGLVRVISELNERHGLGLDSQLAELIEQRLSDAPALAPLLAQHKHRQGDPEAALALINERLKNVDRGGQLRAAYLAWARHPDAIAALHHVLDRAGGESQPIAFVLSQPVTWQNEQLANRAIDLLEAIAGENSPRVMLARATALLQFRAGQRVAMAEAMLLVSDVLQRTPDLLNALRLMAMLHLADDPPDYAAAVQHLERAVAAHPRRSDLYPQLIRLLQRQGDFARAEHYLGQLGRLVGGDDPTLLAELQLLEAQGDFDSILARLSARTGPEADVAEQIAMVTSLHRTGNHHHAERMVREMLAEPEVSSAVISLAANMYADLGRVDDGLNLLEQYEQQHSSGVAAMLLGKYLERLGMAEQAGQWLRLAVERSPERVETWHHLASHYLAGGDLLQARKTAEEGLRIDPSDLSLITVYVIASIHIGGADRREAIALLETLDCHAESLVETLTLYDRVATVRGPDKITEIDLADLRQLVKDHPTYARAWRLAITTHAHAGDIAAAASLARNASSRLPGEAEFAKMAMRLHVQLGDLPRALELARTWRGRSLHRPLDADVAIASIALKLQRVHEAVTQIAAHHDRIIEERRQSPQRLEVLIRVLAGSGSIDQVVSIMSDILEEDERWPALLLELAEQTSTPAAAQLLQLVEPLYSKAGPDAMDMAVRWVRLADTSGEEVHLDQAAALARNAAELDPSLTFSMHMVLGAVAELRFDVESAAEQYQHALAEDPESWIAMTSLAQMLLAIDGRESDAVGLSTRAVNKQPQDADVLNTHARALLAAGHHDAARAVAERVLARSPDHAHTLLTLTQVLAAQGLVDEARSMHERATAALQAEDRQSLTMQTALREAEQAVQAAHMPLSRLDDRLP